MLNQFGPFKTTHTLYEFSFASDKAITCVDGSSKKFDVLCVVKFRNERFDSYEFKLKDLNSSYIISDMTVIANLAPLVHLEILAKAHDAINNIIEEHKALYKPFNPTQSIQAPQLDIT